MAQDGLDPLALPRDQVLLKRLTLIVRGGLVGKVFYPVFPPDRRAGEVLEWIEAQKSRR